jgi:hypothetical protein
MTHDEERKIRDMLADGRLTPAEAESQLEALRRNAEQPAIDIGSGTDEPPPPPDGLQRMRERAQRFKARWWRREYISSYVMLAPMLLMMIGSALMLATAVAVGLAIVALFVPALALSFFWNHVLTAAMGWRPISMVEAYGIAFLLALMFQGVKRWRR